jgi:hypothetical protein
MSIPNDLGTRQTPSPADALTRVASMLLASGTSRGVLPPTALYNEGWMLRLVLEWFARHPPAGHPLDVLPGSSWRSEALLGSAFAPRFRGDPLAESFTHADGVIGNVRAGSGRGDVLPAPSANQFTVVEAKLMSGLSAGTTRAKAYNQAARNVACLADALARGAADLATIRAGFVLLAPASQINAGIFGSWCAKDNIEVIVRARVADYDGQRHAWLDSAFLPALAAVTVDVLSWEAVLAHIATIAPADAESLAAFYKECLTFNRPLRSFNALARTV